MENINFFDGKMSDPEGRGYVMYRKYDDNVYVLMGSYTDKEHRGKGVFKDILEGFINNDVKRGDIVEIALCNKKILPYLLRIGFNKINDPVRHWGNISNGVNLKLIK